MILFGNSIVADVDAVLKRSYWIKMGANTITGVIGPIPLIKREIWTHTKEPMAYN